MAAQATSESRTRVVGCPVGSEGRFPDEVLLYNSLHTSHGVFHVGDAVLLKTCRSENDVAFIRQIRLTPDGRLEVKGQWLYQKHDVPVNATSDAWKLTKDRRLLGEELPTSDPRHLFYSFHYDTFVPDSIVRKCTILFSPPHKALPSSYDSPEFIVCHVYDVQALRVLSVTDTSLPREQHEELSSALLRCKRVWEEFTDVVPAELQESNKVNLHSFIGGTSSSKRSGNRSELSWNVLNSKKRRLSSEGRCLGGGLIQCQQSGKNCEGDENASIVVGCQDGECSCCGPQSCNQDWDLQSCGFSLEVPEDHSSVSGECCKVSPPEVSVTDNLSRADACLGGIEKDVQGCSVVASVEDADAEADLCAEANELLNEVVDVEDYNVQLHEKSETSGPVDIQCPSCGVSGTKTICLPDAVDGDSQERKMQCMSCGHFWASMLQVGEMVEMTLTSDEADVLGLECQEESNIAVGDKLDTDEEADPFVFMKRLSQLSYLVPENRPNILPAQAAGLPPVTLVLDLDETLVHSSMEFCPVSDFNFPVHLHNHVHMVHVRKRPYMASFLQQVARLFEVVVFTASQSIYAEKLLDIIDPNKELIQHRIFRESCVYIEGNYVKDLSVLGRDLSKVIIVDNSPQAFGLQVDNGIPIQPWFNDNNDNELQLLFPFLKLLAKADDVRPLISERFNLREKISNITC